MDDKLFLAVVAFLIAFFNIAPTFLKARANKAAADSEKSGAEADKEKTEADSLRFVLSVAQTAMQNATRMADLERDAAASRMREIEYQAQITALVNELTTTKLRLSRLTSKVSEGMK